MIIVDYSTLSLAAVLQNDVLKAIQVNPDMIRHVIYNSLRLNVSRFKKDYGSEVVIALDSKSWRHDIFPYYKKNRKRSEGIDWATIFAVMEQVQNDIKMVFPYKTLQIENAEADDIIATIATFKHHYNLTQVNYTPTLILARDDDMSQLLKYSTCQMYSPIDKKFIKVDDPAASLKEKVLRGDKGDGIPNVLSDDDTFMIKGKRQKSITEKVLKELLETNFETTSDLKLRKNYERNQRLIDFSFIPQDIQKTIRNTYVNQPIPDSRLLLPHFMDKNLRLMVEHINDF